MEILRAAFPGALASAYRFSHLFQYSLPWPFCRSEIYQGRPYGIVGLCRIAIDHTVRIRLRKH